MQHSKRALEIVQNYILLNDDFMKIVFADKECTQLMLRIILEKPDLEVLEVETEYTVNNLHGRGVRFDVYAKDSAGREYDIEIQRSDKGAGRKRARYNSSMLDANIAEPGDDLENLKETYVIFITENDVMGGNEPLYRIERINITQGINFNDGEHIIYVNGAYDGDDEIGRLMHDFRCSEPNEMYYELMSEKAKYYKESVKGVSDMCREMENLKQEGKTEGLNLLTALLRKLKELGRIEDIDRITYDSDYRDKLISELVLS